MTLASRTRNSILNSSLGRTLHEWRSARARRRFEEQLPLAAREVIGADLQAGRPGAEDCGPSRAIDLAIQWLCRAQDHSQSADGGVARHYSVVDGWAVSYPETTGYIIPTFLSEGSLSGNESLLTRARAMLDWLVDIQMPGGGFQGGVVGASPKVPVTFNTGQILMGLARGAGQFELQKYLAATRSAADWLVASLDDDGCWRKHPSPFAAPGENTYESHVSWGLFEADRVIPKSGYGEAGLRQIRWVISKQQPNGWFSGCISPHIDRPLTHVLGYVLRGILEAYRFSPDPDVLLAADKLARPLLNRLEPDGWLAGRFNSRWEPGAPWVCLTGTAQIAYCWFMLYEITSDDRYAEAGRRANAFLRRTLIHSGDPNTIGAIRGSWPINGEYGQYQFLNWAAKFFIDSNRYEMNLSG